MMAVCAVLCAMTVASCSSDDDGPVDAASLVGRWELYKDYDGEADEWDDEYGEGIDLWIYEFCADGRCISTDGYRSETCLYSVDGNTLVIYEQDPDEPDADRIRIEKLTAAELVLAYDYIGDFDGKHYTDREYYKRID